MFPRFESQPDWAFSRSMTSASETFSMLYLSLCYFTYSFCLYNKHVYILHKVWTSGLLKRIFLSDCTQLWEIILLEDFLFERMINCSRRGRRVAYFKANTSSLEYLNYAEQLLGLNKKTMWASITNSPNAVWNNCFWCLKFKLWIKIYLS